jgi:hypothetical protein
VERRLKDALWVGAVVVIPGAWAFWLIKKILKDVDEKAAFREYVHRTYGYGSRYQDKEDYVDHA